MASSVAGSMSKLKLYNYWKSSSSFRVRFGLHLKGLDFEYIPVNLAKDEQFSPEYVKINPISFVPTLVNGDAVIADSLAILLYLDEKFPQHPFLPSDSLKRAINFQATNIVCSGIQPHQNYYPLDFIEKNAGHDAQVNWINYHIGRGFTALEKLLEKHAGKYATGQEVHLADLFIAPQLYVSINKLKVDMTPYPLLQRLYEEYNKLPAFEASKPDKQPDFPDTA